MTDNNIKYNIPESAKDFPGEFIIFFPEDESPTLLFHSFNADEAYKEASKIAHETKRTPAVIRNSEKSHGATYLKSQ